MKVLIIDDVELSRKSLQGLIEKYCDSVEVIGSADGVETGVALIKQGMPDLIFLDIEMKDGTGFDVLHYFPKRSFEVIFVTAYDKYALEALKNSALEYLLKPIAIEDLKKAVDKASDHIDRLVTREETFSAKIAINSANSIDLIDPKNIIRCKAHGKQTICVMADGTKKESSKNLKEFEILLIKHDFIRVHDSHLINLNHVLKFKKEDGGFVVMSNQDEIPVSQRKKKVFLSSIDLL